MKRLLVCLLAIVLAGCVPVANIARDLVERADGSQLVALTDGIGFDSGDRPALGVLIVFVYDSLVIHELPPGAECEVFSEVQTRCTLGDVTGRTVIIADYQNLDASATFRRPNSNALYHVLLE